VYVRAAVTKIIFTSKMKLVSNAIFDERYVYKRIFW